MNEMGVVTAYNRYESEHAGLAPERVIGRRFFEEVARCADNALVAGRLRDEPELDAVLDYVFTFRLRTTPVRLRLLRSARARHRYLLVDRG
jgi:photoactive yellow protein